MAGLYAGAQAEDQFHEMEIAKEIRDIQSKHGQKRVGHAKGGAIYVKDARATKLSREQEEIAKDNRALVRIWKKKEAGIAGIQARAERQAQAITAHEGESINDAALQFYLRLRPNAEIQPFPELDRPHLHSDASGIEFD